MAELTTPDMGIILLPKDLKAIVSESESDAEESCDMPIPFANLTNNNIILDNSQNIDNSYSDVPLTIVDLDETDNKMNSSCSSPPAVTPKKSCESTSIDPVTPNANLKMLMNVLSPMIRDRENRKRFDNLIEAAEKSREEECVTEANDPQGDEENERNSGGNRKAKSLGLLCQKFLSRYPDYPEDGQVLAIPLDIVSKELNVERRRIYDIVNVLESVEMVSRRAKNKYVWHGKASLLSTLKRLQELGEKENYGTRMARLQQLQIRAEFDNDLRTLKKKPLADSSNIPSSQNNQIANSSVEKADSRKEKSLGVMSQKFIMLFLVSRDSRLISLDDAARILIGDDNFQIDENSKLKTKVRRLYDIANILSSLQLIKKVHVTETRGRKPAFQWIGPHPQHTEVNIDTVAVEKRPVTKHSLLCSTPSPSTSSRKRSWARHASFNVMCDVVEKERKAFSSAPSSPVKQEQDLDESFQADFEALKKKYPAQVSSLVSRNLCNEEDIPVSNVVQETGTSLPLPSVRVTKNTNTKSIASNGSGPCRALFGENNDANNFLLSDSEVVGSCEKTDTMCSSVGGKQDHNSRKSKRPLLMPKNAGLIYQPVVKKTRTEVDALALLQQHGFTQAQIEDLIKEGKTLKVVRVFPGTSGDEPAKTYVATEEVATNPSDIQENLKNKDLDRLTRDTSGGTEYKDVDLVCQEAISPLPRKSIKNKILDDEFMAGTNQRILTENIYVGESVSPGLMQNGRSSCENMTNFSSSNLNDTPIKPDGIDITKFPTKKLYNSSPRQSVNAPSQERYLLSWLAPPVSPHCRSICRTSIADGIDTQACLHKNTCSPSGFKMISSDGSAVLPPSAQPHKSMVVNPLAISHQMHPGQFRSQTIGLAPTRSGIISPYQYPYLPRSRFELPAGITRPEFHQHDASSLLKGLTNLSPIQPTTKPNPYITPPTGSIMKCVVSHGLTSFQHKMPGKISLPVQRQLALSKTPDSKS